MTISWKPSPNYSQRDPLRPIKKLVLHNTAGPAGGAIAWLCDVRSKVSAHYVLSRNGSITQLVRDDATAWHAGDRPANLESIGIEIEAHAQATGMTPMQDAALVDLIKWICGKHQIAFSKIFLHRQIVKTECPGFVWPRDADWQQWRTERGLV